MVPPESDGEINVCEDNRKYPDGTGMKPKAITVSQKTYRGSSAVFVQLIL